MVEIALDCHKNGVWSKFSDMKLLYKLFRVVRHPRLCFSVLPYKFFGMLVAIKTYRRFVLPLVVRRIKCRTRINVVFLAMNPDMWRYDGVYRKFESNPRFNLVVVTAMRNIPQMEIRVEEQESMVAYFSCKGFNVLRGYDSVSKKWINLKSLKPDIIFYTQPYNNVIERSFEYFHHLGSLLCYTPYSFQLSDVDWNWNNNLQQYCWKLFYVGNEQLEQCNRLSRIGKRNAVAAGYCFEEEYAESIKDTDAAKGAWRNDARKRIIWAPHHSIAASGWFKVSSFLEIADFMLRLRNEFRKQVVVAFKPHPVLKTKLYKIWGKAKTDAYYADWASSTDSFYAQGDYHALFAGSDAMIHCSGSFIIEYLYTGKPVAYVYSKTRNSPDIGPIGDAALEAHYPAHSEADIRRFVEEVIIGENDTMREIRKDVTRKYLKSPNGKMFSENVYENILEGLGL